MDQPNKTQQLKKSLLAALEKSYGLVSVACEAVECARSTYYYHYNDDPEFRDQVDDICNVAFDMVENALIDRIKKGDTTAIIFYLKTKARGRGYVEKQEFGFTDKQGNDAPLNLTDNQFEKLLETARATKPNA